MTMAFFFVSIIDKKNEILEPNHLPTYLFDDLHQDTNNRVSSF